ncbi:MAG: Alpha-D-ribose 1-methylphosphonate 5-phosphate C-P lyase [Firmicutes bacterium]|nr:Alpha-D-ribose 1-methylphosphonate 5-phosphate C-P lyase [Bacillota bacterium]
MSKYNFAFFDEGSKREIRRATLKAIAIPGYQVPFASREMPIARGWGTGGLQLTLSLVGTDDVIKVIDQGTDESVNAVNIKKLIKITTGIKETEKTAEATIIQSRHRIPETELREDQIIVLQVPLPEPLRIIEPSEYVTKRLHADQEYSGIWLMLFEQIMQHGRMATGADHPVLVNDRYVMAPSPIPRFDNPKMHCSKALILLGAGREKKIYAVPPYTKVQSLAFEDYPFEVEDMSARVCRLCGAKGIFMDELIDEETQEKYYQCNDVSYCLERLNNENDD